MGSGTPRLLLRWQQSHPRDVRIQVSGEIDQATVGQLGAALANAAARHPGRVALDLAGVEFMACCGMRCILDAHRRLPGLRIVGAAPPVRRLALLYGAGRLLEADPALAAS